VSTDLIAWLRRQLDEEERLASRLAARYRVRNPDRADDGQLFWPLPSVEAQFRHAGDPDIAAGLDLIRAWSPARVLAEVAAKRRIIDLRDVMADVVQASEGTVLAGASKVRLGAYENVLRLLALPYAARPGYREEWRL
jgi:hypothetical protein